MLRNPARVLPNGIFSTLPNPAEQFEVEDLWRCTQLWRAVLDRALFDFCMDMPEKSGVQQEASEFWLGGGGALEEVCAAALVDPDWARRITLGVYQYFYDETETAAGFADP